VRKTALPPRLWWAFRPSRDAAALVVLDALAHANSSLDRCAMLHATHENFHSEAKGKLIHSSLS